MQPIPPPSPQPAAEIIVAALQAAAPGLIRDGKVDLEGLKNALGYDSDEEAERFGLYWSGKLQAGRLASTPSLGTLRPKPDDSVNWETTQNLMIEGDNLEVLKLLSKSYAGKAKLVYIDPPYNTGKDFVYPDAFADNIDHYQTLMGWRNAEGEKTSSLARNSETGGRFHTAWLNMIYPRLILSRDLLQEDGVLIISIDDAEVMHLRLVLDGIFGQENFIACIVMETATDNNPTQVNIEHEYMLVYGRRKSALPDWEIPSAKGELIFKQYQTLLKEYGNDPATIQRALRTWIRANKDDLSGVTHYDNVDERGVFHDGDIANTKMGGYHYEVPHPRTGKPCKIPEKGFRFPEATLRKMIAEGDILFGEDESTLIKPKKRIENARELLKSVIYEDGRASTKRLDQLLARGVFSHPKSETFLQKLLEFVTSPDSLVVDFFAGSATTGHAVMAQNAQDEGSRRFLLVQLPEPLLEKNKDQKAAMAFCDRINRPRTIAEITKERLRRAADKIRTTTPNTRADLGFRVFELDASNLRAWDPNQDLETHLLANENHVLPGRSEEDLLFEILLRLGIELTAPMDAQIIAGKRVSCIAGGRLFSCLANSISREEAVPLAEGIAAWRLRLDPNFDSRVVFLDSAFADDVTKTNLESLLCQQGFHDTHLLSL